MGSTSIPAVHAKPILDIAILCGEKSLDPLIRALKGLGYEYRGQFDDEAGHYYAVRDSGGTPLCQAHIFAEATPDRHAKLKFRDVLRRDHELAREYDEYKRGLAGVAANKTEYAEIKTRWVDTFILKVMRAAVDA